MKLLCNYDRVEFEGTPIYVNAQKPDWFIPTSKADLILRMLKAGESIYTVALKYSRLFGGGVHYSYTIINNLLSRLDHNSSPPYKERSQYHHLKKLKECWFHLTNRCNMACAHCMFFSDSGHQPSLTSGEALRAIDEASRLGCKIFYLTGGEPLVYGSFTAVCDKILRKPNTHLVIFTNGKILKKFDPCLKSLSRERVHFQVSCDGLEKSHNFLRGEGAFGALTDSLKYLHTLEFPVTLAMSVNKTNVHEMASIVEIAETFKIKNIHYLWLFRKGRISPQLFVTPRIIFPELVKAYERAKARGIAIDNLEIFKSQIFSLPETRFDLSNAAWESLAIGPDGCIYPSPALIGEKELAAGEISQGLERIWKTSPVLEGIRKASLIDDEETRKSSLAYLTGGEDIDHSYIAAKSFVGADPYKELYDRMVLYLLSKEAASFDQNDSAGMVCRMGERLYRCDEDSASVRFTHSNCVLSLPGKDGHYPVKSFYSEAAESINDDIVNPIRYEEEEISHIPDESRIRSYGCGSPVLDCNLKEGEVLVDLGCGTGIECFIAAKRVGTEGRVYGIDMSEQMLSIARKSSSMVTRKLGYSNVGFCTGLLEKIPLASAMADVVISNCVINLCPDKRRTFSEILRILKPGGRMCISDIVCEEDLPLELKYSKKLRGECIGGALRENELFSMLEDLSFAGIFLKRRFLYRRVRGYNFHSVTFVASRPGNTATRHVVYRGPFAAVITDNGEFLRRGRRASLRVPSNVAFDESFLVVDEKGNVGNGKQKINCSCLDAAQKERPA